MFCYNCGILGHDKFHCQATFIPPVDGDPMIKFFEWGNHMGIAAREEPLHRIRPRIDPNDNIDGQNNVNDDNNDQPPFDGDVGLVVNTAGTTGVIGLSNMRNNEEQINALAMREVQGLDVSPNYLSLNVLSDGNIGVQSSLMQNPVLIEDVQVNAQANENLLRMDPNVTDFPGLYRVKQHMRHSSGINPMNTRKCTNPRCTKHNNLGTLYEDPAVDSREAMLAKRNRRLSYDTIEGQADYSPKIIHIDDATNIYTAGGYSSDQGDRVEDLVSKDSSETLSHLPSHVMERQQVRYKVPSAPHRARKPRMRSSFIPGPVSIEAIRKRNEAHGISFETNKKMRSLEEYFIRSLEEYFIYPSFDFEEAPFSISLSRNELMGKLSIGGFAIRTKTSILIMILIKIKLQGIDTKNKEKQKWVKLQI